jgi:hyperosmotically inducible protein
MKILLAPILGAAIVFGNVALAADNPIQGAAAPSANPVPESAQPGTDVWITTKVRAELMTTKDIPSTSISVATTNGVVTLSGVLDTKAQVQKSVAVAQAVKGVNRVDSTALTSRNNR